MNELCILISHTTLVPYYAALINSNVSDNFTTDLSAAIKAVKQIKSKNKNTIYCKMLQNSGVPEAVLLYGDISLQKCNEKEMIHSLQIRLHLTMCRCADRKGER